MAYVLRFIETAAGEAHDNVGKWLVRYDPDYHWPPSPQERSRGLSGHYDGGDLETTDDKSKARRFDSPGEALAVWKSGPSCWCHRLRIDGEPNRPLAAFTCEISSIP